MARVKKLDSKLNPIGFVGFDGLWEHVRKIDCFERVLKLACLNLLHIEDVVDQGQKAQFVRLCDLSEIHRLFRHVSDGPVHDEAERCADRGQCCASDRAQQNGWVDRTARSRYQQPADRLRIRGVSLTRRQLR